MAEPDDRERWRGEITAQVAQLRADLHAFREESAKQHTELSALVAKQEERFKPLERLYYMVWGSVVLLAVLLPLIITAISFAGKVSRLLDFIQKAMPGSP